jgi:hypothetical protein
MNTHTASIARPDACTLPHTLPCASRPAVVRARAAHRPLRQSLVQRDGFKFLRLEGSFAEVCAALDRLCALES